MHLNRSPSWYGDRTSGRLRTSAFIIGVVGLTFGVAASIAYAVLQLSNFRQEKFLMNS